MQSFLKYTRFLRSLSSIAVRENVHKNALSAECCNYHTVVNNQCPSEFKRSELGKFQLHNPITSVLNVRFKSKKKKYTKPEIYSDDEEEGKNENDAEDEILGKGIELKTVKVTNLRMDHLYKLAFNVTRGTIEKAFYENKFRLNGEKIKKKATSANVGDEIDFIRGPCKENRDLLEVNRVEVLSYQPNEAVDALLVKIRKSRALIIENYPPPNSWKPPSEEETT